MPTRHITIRLRNLKELEEAHRRQQLQAAEDAAWVAGRRAFEQGLFAAQPELPFQDHDPLPWKFLTDEERASSRIRTAPWKKILRRTIMAVLIISPLLLLLNKARRAARG